MADSHNLVAIAARRGIERAGAILETDGPDPQFLHSVLCQVSLPRNPTRETMFTRSCGQVSITLQAGPLFDGVKLPPVAETTAKEQRPVLPELPLRHRITDGGLDRLRDVCPGWDRQWLLLRFMAVKPAPRNADASLVAWGRKFTEGKAP
jgi:hypothetical protein